MDLKEFLLLEKSKMLYDVSVKFKKEMSPKGPIMVLSTNDEKHYAIAASVYNYNRFKKWNGKEATADIQLIGKRIRMERGSIPLVKIRTNIKFEKDFDEKENDNIF